MFEDGSARHATVRQHGDTHQSQMVRWSRKIGIVLLTIWTGSSICTQVIVIGAASYMGYHLMSALHRANFTQIIGIDVLLHRNDSDGCSGYKNNQRAWSLMSALDLHITQWDICEVGTVTYLADILSDDPESQMIYVDSTDTFTDSGRVHAEKCLRNVLKSIVLNNGAAKISLTYVTDRGAADIFLNSLINSYSNMTLQSSSSVQIPSNLVLGSWTQGKYYELLKRTIVRMDSEEDEENIVKYSFVADVMRHIINTVIANHTKGVTTSPKICELPSRTFRSFFDIQKSGVKSTDRNWNSLSPSQETCISELKSFSKMVTTTDSMNVLKLPCASACSCRQDCYASGFDAAGKQARASTAGCVIVYYTVGMHRKQAGLTDVDNLMDKRCYVAFVKVDSPIGRGSAVYANGWQIIRVDGTHMEKLIVSRRASRLPKINPDSFFAKTVRYAVYFDTGSIPKLDPKHIDGLMTVDGKKISIAMLFHRMQMTGWHRSRSPMSEISAVLRSNHSALIGDLTKQRYMYQRATNVSNGRLRFRVMPVGTFIIHNIKSQVGRKFRCEWLYEYLYWGDRDQPPLYYIIANTLMDHAWNVSSIIPLGTHNGEYEYLRLFNSTPDAQKYLPYYLEGGDRGYDFLHGKNSGR